MSDHKWIEHQFVSPKDKIRQVMAFISKSPIGIAIVVDSKKKMIGYLQDADIRRAILKGTNLSSPVEKIMNRNPFTLPFGLSREKQLEELKKAKRLKAPVVDKNGKVRDIALYWKLQDDSHKTDFYVDIEKLSDKKHVPSVMVVGGAGYIGSILCRLLLEKGYRVKVLDKLIFGDDSIKDLYTNKNFTLIKGDILNTDTVVDAVFGMDYVINLAAIVGDPACSLDESRTIMVNYISAKMLADICKHMKVKRYVFASTCSVYGASKGKMYLTEESKLNPVSVYAETKLKTEWGVLELADQHFSPCVLRLATVFGFSPRPRFDLMINIFTAMAVQEGKINVFGGDQYRPNIHVRDAARAFMRCIEAPKAKMHQQIFNAGSTDLNFKIDDIAGKVAQVIPGTEIVRKTVEMDKRDYNVDFEKIRKDLKFQCETSIEDGVAEIVEALKNGVVKDHAHKAYSNFQSTFLEIFTEQPAG